MHSIRGQALPSTYLEHPHDPPTHKPTHKNKDEEKEKDKKAKEKEKKKAFTKEQERMVSTSLLTTTAFLGSMATPTSATTTTTTTSSSTSASASSHTVPPPPSPSSPAYSSSGRNRSSSSTSSLTVPSSAGVIEGNRSRSSSNTSSRPSSLFRHKQSTGVDDKEKDHQQQQHQPHAGFGQHHQQSHFYLQKRQPSNPSSLPPPLLPKHSSSSTSSSSSSIFRRTKHAPTPTTPTSTSTHIHTNHHSILMVPQHDIHITWPHPVPSGNIYIAGTWSVPGHGPWEKLAMTPVEGTDSLFEIHLNVNEIENIADYLDDEGHIHHELTAEGHHHPEEAAAAIKLSKRQRLRRFFGRAKGKNSKDGATTPLPGQAHTHLPHDAFLPLTKEYRYQYKFVVDDQWICDADRPQVQDNEGHWNHELVVELIEQIQGSSSSDSVRSRSSSLQSVQSVNNAHLSDAHPYQPPQPLTDLSAISTTKPTPQEDEVKRVFTHSAQASSSSSRPRDTYEAIMIFDERDDLSDGEGGRIRRKEVDDSEVTSANKVADQ
ncbi:hypothetical protein BG000_005201, partial [Podila horticola]